MEFDFGIENKENTGVFDPFSDDIPELNEIETSSENEPEEEITDEEDPQESVGNEDDEKEDVGEEDTPDSDEDGSSQLYPSIADALLEDGVFSSLTKEDVKAISSAEDLSKAFDEELKSRLDERQRRIEEALNSGVEKSKISVYEQTLSYLDKISEEDIKNEDNAGLRKNLIYQSLINTGKSEERALREVEKSFKNGNDVEDALDAFQDNLEFYTNAYDKEIEEAKKQKEKEEALLQERANSIQKAFEEKGFYESLGITEKVGKRALEDVTIAKYKDPDTGEKITAIQKAQREDEAHFLRGLGIAFTLTDGFKDFSKLGKGLAAREVKTKLKNLEDKLRRIPSGGLGYVGKSKDKPKKIEL